MRFLIIALEMGLLRCPPIRDFDFPRKQSILILSLIGFLAGVIERKNFLAIPPEKFARELPNTLHFGAMGLLALWSWVWALYWCNRRWVIRNTNFDLHDGDLFNLTAAALVLPCALFLLFNWMNLPGIFYLITLAYYILVYTTAIRTTLPESDTIAVVIMIISGTVMAMIVQFVAMGMFSGALIRMLGYKYH